MLPWSRKSGTLKTMSALPERSHWGRRVPLRTRASNLELPGTNVTPINVIKII